jgi:hypothetical protein
MTMIIETTKKGEWALVTISRVASVIVSQLHSEVSKLMGQSGCVI